MSFIDTMNGWVSYKSHESDYSQIWRTHDSGETWEKLSGATSSWLPIFSIQFIDENNGWFSSGSFIDSMDALNIYHTTDGGKTWELLHTFESRAAQEKIYVIPPDTVWCGLNGGVLFRSTDGGYSWEEMSAGLNTSFFCFEPFGGNYAGSRGYAFHLLNVGGVDGSFWLIDFNTKEVEELEPGPTSPDSPYHVAIAGRSYWATTYKTNEIWRYTPTATEVADKQEPISLDVRNYPNPFNPSTTISFTLANAAPVTLTVHDTAGQVAATLIDGTPMDTGRHEVVFDGSGLASGLYFYRINAGAAVKTGKMALVK